MPRWLAGALCAATLCVSGGLAAADAVIEHYTRSDGLGGLGGFEGTSVTVTGPTAQRSESTFRFTGSFLSAIQKMAGSGDHLRIVRLDRDLVWTLDLEKKTYTETPLTARLEREQRGPGAPPPPREQPETSDVVITRNEFKVEKTGAKKAVNGFPCEEYLATWLVETRNQKTGETATSTLTTHLWTTPQTAEIRAAQAEEQAYQRAYLEKLKLEMSPAEARTFGLAALAAATGLDEAERQKALERLASEMRKVQGYPIVTQVDWQIEGSGSAGGSGESQPARGAGGSPSGLGDLGNVLGKLFGGGTGASKGGSGDGGPAGQQGGRPIFSLYTEVKSVKVTPPDPTRYDVPAGYTRK